MNKEQADKKEFLEWEEPTDGGQSPQGTNVVPEDQYKSLQAEYTRSNQEKIDLAVRLAKQDKSYINEIQDKKLQDKVIKELYWFSSLEEAKAVYGDSFMSSKEEESDDYEEDKATKLEKELKLMKWKQDKKEMEAEITRLKSKYDNFLSDEDVAKVEEELKYISDSLPIEERVKRAGNIVLNSKYSPEDLAYKLMKDWGWASGVWGVSSWEEQQSKNSEIDSIFDNVLSNYKNK